MEVEHQLAEKSLAVWRQPGARSVVGGAAVVESGVQILLTRDDIAREVVSSTLSLARAREKVMHLTPAELFSTKRFGWNRPIFDLGRCSHQIRPSAAYLDGGRKRTIVHIYIDAARTVNYNSRAIEVRKTDEFASGSNASRTFGPGLAFKSALTAFTWATLGCQIL